MKASYNGREVYERLIQAGRVLSQEKSLQDCSETEVEARAEVEAGSFDRFFDRMEELAGVVMDRTVKETMERCAEILSSSTEPALQRLDEMFSVWEEKVEEIDALFQAAGEEIPAMKGHILTCLELYNQLAVGISKVLEDAAAQGQCICREAEFAGQALAYGLLRSRYQGLRERELLNRLRGAFEELLFTARAANMTYAS